MTSQTAEVEEDVQTPVEPGPGWLEMADDEDAVAALDCDAGSAPGADLDGAVLYSNPTRVEELGHLRDCAWTEPQGACPNNAFSDPRQLEGPPTGSKVDGFVALNGGSIRCRWDVEAGPQLGNVIYVVEVSAENTTEPHRIRACADADGSECGPWVTTKDAGQTHPAGALIF